MIWGLNRKSGPIKWCKTCHRKHKARGGCDLVRVTRIAKSGRKVERWAHPDPSSKHTKKSSKRGAQSKARKS